MTNWPRLWDLEHSDCQVGTVDVLRPLPKLAIIVSIAQSDSIEARTL